MRRPWWWAALLTITLLYGLYAWPAEQAIRPVAHIDSAAALLRQRRLDAAATDERAAGVAHTTPDNDSVISSEGSDRTTASATVSIQGAATGETGGAGHRDSASSTGFGGPAFFSAGQSAEARRSVELAIEKQQAPKEGAFLWGNVQATVAQAEKESDNVRRLLQADDMLSWRPDLSKLPPQRPADASMEKLLEHVPRGGTAWLAFGNAGVTEMLLNWAHHVIALGYGWQMVVAAFDEALLLSLHERRIPAYNYTGALPTTHFRHAPYLFHRMGYLKADCIRLVLETGRHVLVSDSDVAWVADPLPLIESMKAEGANICASTDCLDLDADRDKTPRPGSPVQCGHSPGNTHGAVLNTGVLWFRSCEEGISLARQWALDTLGLRDPYSDDQGAFNNIFARRMYPVRAYSDSGRVIGPISKGTFGKQGLLLAPMPADRFCSGHMVWVQQEGDVRDCLSVHATFTEYGDGGKRFRFLEAGLWAVLPPSYYADRPDRRYLTFDPPRAGPDPMPCKPGEGHHKPGQLTRDCGGEDPAHGLPPKPMGKEIYWQEGLKRSVRLRANVALMARQVHALRDAMGIARVLNRTLVIPHFECLCDRSEYPDIMPSCIYQGGPRRLKLPFKCSTHFVTDTHKLQLMGTEPTRFGMQPHKFNGKFTQPLPIRAYSFLTDARTDPTIKRSVIDVHMGGGGGVGGENAVVLPPKATNEDVLERLRTPQLQQARVLRLSDAEGAFGGWVSNADESLLFNTMMDYYLYRGAWCCTSRFIGNNADNGRVYLKGPPPLRRPSGG